MKITEAQLDEYVALYKAEFGEDITRLQATVELQKLLHLVLYLAYPESTLQALEEQI